MIKKAFTTILKDLDFHSFKENIKIFLQDVINDENLKLDDNKIRENIINIFFNCYLKNIIQQHVDKIIDDVVLNNFLTIIENNFVKNKNFDLNIYLDLKKSFSILQITPLLNIDKDLENLFQQINENKKIYFPEIKSFIDNIFQELIFEKITKILIYKQLEKDKIIQNKNQPLSNLPLDNVDEKVFDFLNNLFNYLDQFDIQDIHFIFKKNNLDIIIKCFGKKYSLTQFIESTDYNYSFLQFSLNHFSENYKEIMQKSLKRKSFNVRIQNDFYDDKQIVIIRFLQKYF